MICHGCRWFGVAHRYTVQGSEHLYPHVVDDDSIKDWQRLGWTVTFHSHEEQPS